MSQHDFVIDNQNAPASRADINNALQALASCSSGTTAPVATYANMLWYDTINDMLKIRNEANSAWITLGTVDQTNSVFNPNFLPATQAEAEAGTNNAKGMTALRVAQAIAALGGLADINIQSFTASGTYTPTAGYKRALIIATGGGEGGNGSVGSSGASSGGDGGGGGGTVFKIIDISAGSSSVVTIGAGGTSGFGNGGTTSVGSLAIAAGGGSATTQVGDFIIPISPGGGGNGQVGPGQGGSSFWGINAPLATSTIYGAGGSGSYNSNGASTGRAGSSGVVFILEFK